MINLDGVQPFAEGGNRRCYVHPENSYRCLKVTIQAQSKIAKKMLLGIKNLEVNPHLMTIFVSKKPTPKEL